MIPLYFQYNTWAMRKGLGYEPRTDEMTLATAVGYPADQVSLQPTIPSEEVQYWYKFAIFAIFNKNA